MPLTKRAVSPVRVSLNRLPQNVRQNELACVANGTLANLVRQLSSLSKHAENIFGELFHEALKLDHKTEALQNRTERLRCKVSQLESSTEEVTLQDLQLRKPFKSSTLTDQQALSRQTIPVAMAECYQVCDRPPELDRLNPYRDDGKNGLKFYTDPDYFFELWRQEMLKDTEHHKKAHKPKVPGERKQRHKVRQAQDHNRKYVEQALRTGEHIQILPAEYQTPDLIRQGLAPGQQSRYIATNGSAGQVPQGMYRPDSLTLPQYGSTSGFSSSNDSVRYSMVNGPSHPRVNVSVQQQQQQQDLHYGAGSGLQARAGPGAHHYLAAGYSLGPMDLDSASTLTPDQGSPHSADSSVYGTPRGVRARPTQPPPAPPPPMPADTPAFNQLNQTTSGKVYTGAPPKVGPVVGQPLGGSHAYIPNGSTRQQMQRLNLSNAAVAPTISQQAVMSDRTDGAAFFRGSSPDLPPPPPPFKADDGKGRVVSSGTIAHPAPVAAAPPPPPPPPPPVLGAFGAGVKATMPSNPDATSFTPSASAAAAAAAHAASSSSPGQRQASPAHDPHSDLLRAIREGIQLKKVEEKKEKERVQASANAGHDVASILKRRIAMEISDSEEEPSGSDFEDNWSD